MTQDDSLDDELDPTVFDVPQYEETAKPLVKNPPTHHNVNLENLSTYIYPTNLQLRDYQYNIVNRALFHNLLVALPTGLGKTFIASTVILNFLRWFPNLKLIFMAPTKPLVAQQIRACCGITGIPSTKVAILLDKTRRNRAAIWDEKLVFFTTPQVVENDLATGIVDPKLVVLLVIDEAHRAKGNYAYNNVVKFLNRFNNSYRILALTATPASDVDGVQEIVNNLCISKVEVRTERSIDIFKYLKRKTIDRVAVGQSDEIHEAVDLLSSAIAPVLETANQRKIYEVREPLKINAFTALDAQHKLSRNPNIPEGLKWANYFILLLLVVVGQCLKRLNIYGIRSFYSYFYEKHKEFTTKYNSKKSKNELAAKFYFHEKIKELLAKCEFLIQDREFLGHPKLEVVISELTTFFQNTTNSDSRVIIFTEFRESALDIVRAIEQLGSELKPHIFIGQAKEKEKFDEDKFLKKGKKKKGAEPKEKSSKEWKTSSERAQVSGMNQKMQKDLIKKFKSGVYNILVATSIGEEGLDIGEVDLIVCFDSTSSPIKNVQRMGRTGRNREGKVLLLFSGNEEKKFDKAMGGYEYIQQHIMNNNLIELSEQNRILPLNYTPVVEEKFIEIPPENLEIKSEEDDDEIIKIATKYMTGKSKSKKASKTGKPSKIEKRFFMPDDVEKGFTPVSMMLKRKNDTESVGEKKRREERPRDLLDTILDSDEDNLIPGEHSPFDQESETSEKDSKENNTSGKEVVTSVTHNDMKPPTADSSMPKTLGLRRPQIDKVLKLSTSAKVYHQPTLDLVQHNRSKKNPAAALGVKKRPPNVLEQLKGTPNSKISDDFDDDDDELLELARKTSSFNSQPQDVTVKILSLQLPRDTLFDNHFSESEGLLTNEERSELYMSYYVPAEAYELRDCYNPNEVAQDRGGLIPHGRTSLDLIKVQAFMAKITDSESKYLAKKSHSLKSLTPPMKDIIDFE